MTRTESIKITDLFHALTGNCCNCGARDNPRSPELGRTYFGNEFSDGSQRGFRLRSEWSEHLKYMRLTSPCLELNRYAPAGEDLRQRFVSRPDRLLRPALQQEGHRGKRFRQGRISLLGAARRAARSANSREKKESRGAPFWWT